MKAHPYRHAPPAPPPRPAEPCGDHAEAVVIAVIWLTSVLRFGLAVRHGELFSGQPLLAFAIAELVPILVVRHWLRRRARR